jgi:hypothetical protein
LDRYGGCNADFIRPLHLTSRGLETDGADEDVEIIDDTLKWDRFAMQGGRYRDGGEEAAVAAH